MEILAGPADWTPNDEEQLAKFLDSETGKRLIPALVQKKPSLLPAGDVNAILIRSGEVRSFDTIIEELFFLAHPPKRNTAAPATEYPPLEDDTAWRDGQKIQPETETPTQ